MAGRTRPESCSPRILQSLQLLHSEFPNIWGKFSFLFYQCSCAVFAHWVQINFGDLTPYLTNGPSPTKLFLVRKNRFCLLYMLKNLSWSKICVILLWMFGHRTQQIPRYFRQLSSRFFGCLLQYAGNKFFSYLFIVLLVWVT